MHKFLNIFYLSIYLCLTCFGLYFSSPSEAGVQLGQWFNPLWYGVSARALAPYPAELDNSRSCTPASEDELKENPKYVR
jgi:hypothetical protein